MHIVDHSARPELSAPVVIETVRVDASDLIVANFVKHFYSNGIEQPDKAEHWTVELPFTLLKEDDIPNALVPVNPIGLQIQDMRETKGF
jgi:type IV secretory pathway component VirB8